MVAKYSLAIGENLLDHDEMKEAEVYIGELLKSPGTFRNSNMRIIVLLSTLKSFKK